MFTPLVVSAFVSIRSWLRSRAPPLQIEISGSSPAAVCPQEVSARPALSEFCRPAALGLAFPGHGRTSLPARRSVQLIVKPEIAIACIARGFVSLLDLEEPGSEVRPAARQRGSTISDPKAKSGDSPYGGPRVFTENC
jgi:hypothetical protein